MRRVRYGSVHRLVLVWAVLCVACGGCSNKSGSDDVNSTAIIKLGKEVKKVKYLVESAYWPSLDFSDVQPYIAEPEPERKARFVKLTSQIMDANYLAEELGQEVHFLRGWRGKGEENFVMQYEKGGYVMRIKSQVTHVQAAPTRRDTSHWMAVAIQGKDKRTVVDKESAAAILGFCDRFLSPKVGSGAQDYSGVKNMDRPAFQKKDEGYLVAYRVAASKPNICGVCIWSDGRTVIINLKEESRKVIIYP